METLKKTKIIRVTTGGMFQAILLKGQLSSLAQYFDMLSLSHPDAYQQQTAKREQVRTIGVEMAREISPVKDVQSYFQLRKVFKKEKPGIVHASTPKASLLSMMAAYTTGVPVRMLTPTGFRFVGLTGFKRKLVFFFEKMPFRFASHIFPESQGVINTIRKYNMTRKQLTLIGSGSVNGVNLAVFSSTAIDEIKLTAIKTQIAYDPALTYLLFVGRIVRDKGIEELLYAFSKLDNNVRLIILGPFEAGDPVPEKSVQLIKNNPAIIHIDWTDDVQYFMQLSNLLVHPSYREGLPNVLLQGGAMECPIICSAIEGNMDIVENERTGILFASKDAEDLSDKLQFALTHPVQMKQYAMALRLKIEKQFDQRIVIETLKNKYMELAAGKAAE